MHINDRNNDAWNLIETSFKTGTSETKKINSELLRSLTAEIQVNPAVGAGLAAKVIKYIDTSQMDTKVLKDFIYNLTDKQTLRGKFCTELKDKTPFVLELFNKFQEQDENLMISLIASVPHLSEVELNQLLKRAIETKKEGVVKELLKKDFSIEGDLFHLACEEGMESVVLAMVAKDKQLLNVKNENGMTPLLVALIGENEAIASMLIDQGADVTLPSSTGISPLHAACVRDLPGMVTKILDTDKSVLNATDNQGMTALMYSLTHQRESIALMLLEQGADASIRIVMEAPIHIACRNGMEAIVTKILEQDRKQLNVKDNDGFTPLIQVIFQKNNSLANQLIDLGADVKALTVSGKMAISYACKEGLEEVITKIIEQDYSLLEAKIPPGHYTLLHETILDKNEKSASCLMELGASLYAETDKGELAIHLACQQGLIKLVSDMIEIDDNLLNIKDKEGATPLMKAIGSGGDKTAEMLIELGADLKVTDKQGYTALHRACRNDRFSIASKILQKDPEVVYIYPIVNKLSNTPLKLAADSRQETFALEMIRFSSAELTSIQPLLAEATSYQQAELIIRDNLEKILDPTQNATGANPLKVALLLGDADLFHDIQAKLGEDYPKHLASLKGLDSAFIERTALKVEPKHFAKGSLVTETPAMPDFELDKLKNLFNAINFTNPQAPGYKNPLKLRDEDRTTNSDELKAGLNNTIDRLKKREAYMGTPPPDTPELTAYFDRFEAYIKNIGQLIEGLDDPTEKATHLIDIAIMGLHCGGKIGEAASLYRLLSGQMAEGFEPQICDALRDYRLGIIEDWVTKAGRTNYEVHRFNQYMFLLGKELQLPGSETFTSPDRLAGLTLTSEEALSKFSEIYRASTLIDFTQGFILDSLKIKSIREACVDWIRDHAPTDWQKEKYTGILDKIRALEEDGVSRQEIRAKIQREAGIAFPVADPDPTEAIKLHRQRDYNNNVPKVEEWRKDFYSPIFAEIERMGETANFTEYLTSKKITKKPVTSQADAKAAVIERRRKDFFFNKPEESNWKEAFYGDIFKAVEGMQSRDEIRRTLQEKGVELEPDRDFENLLEQVRGLEYLSTVFQYNAGGTNVTGIDRVAVRNMLEQMEVITY